MNYKLLTMVMVLMGISCQKGNPDKESDSKIPYFTMIDALTSGIQFENRLHDDPMGVRNVLSFHHYYNGSGVAAGDVNNDGLPDLFFAANEGPNRLFLNKGNMQFEDITESSGVNPSGKNWAVGAVMADVNQDGWLDIYICQAGYTLYPDRIDRENLLLINNQDGTFTERAKEYGINDDNESTSAAFFDYDKDGDLDLYVLNESIYAFVIFQKVFEDLKDPEKLAQATGNLYRNDGGHFTKVTKEAGVERYGYGLGLVVNDINGDGWTDIYVANDYSVPDFMFINNGDGTFTDSIKEKTRQISFFGMGCDIADINNDALPEIAVVDMAANDHYRDKTLMTSMDVEGFWYFIDQLGYQYQYMFNTLQLNNGNGTFSNIAAMAGLLRTDWSWAALLADFDLDGYKDYFVSNGFRRYARDNDFRNEMTAIRERNGGSVPLELRPELYEKMPQIKDANFMFRNNGDLSFSAVTEEWGLTEPAYSNGALYADLDQDGDLDLVINNIDGPAFLMKNNAREKGAGNYLTCLFKGDSPGDNTYNTKVTLYHADQKQYQEFHPVRGYASSMNQELLFGLGRTELIDSIKVEWPEGRVQIIEKVTPNQRITFRKQDAQPIPRNKQSLEMAFQPEDPIRLGLEFKHQENEFNDFAREVLLPHKQSTQGPAMASADVNGDGLTDLYIGGAMNQAGILYIQRLNGHFEKATSQPWQIHIGSEDVAAHFFDADNDGDMDLYVASGGGGDYKADSEFLQDRIYINFGEKGFAAVNALPVMADASSSVASSDIDGDGFRDLFVGGAAIPGRYPYACRSYILKFSGNNYIDATAELAPGLERPGIVRDAVFADINGDGKDDLVVVGEWMGVLVYIHEGGKLVDRSEQYGTDSLMGWWYSVQVADLNQDGRQDIVLGNLGRNTKFSASPKKPFNVFANDFDKNGTVDIVLSKEYDGKLVPARGRQCSSEQMPYIKTKFPTFQQFASADLEDILGEKNLEEALHLQVTTFESMVLLNEGEHFQIKKLPVLAQKAPVNSIIVHDLNGDSHSDLIIAGNMYEAEVETPRYDSGTGQVLLGDGKGNFTALPVWQTGLYAAGNVKNACWLKSTNSDLFVAGNNNDGLSVFRIREQAAKKLK